MITVITGLAFAQAQQIKGVVKDDQGKSLAGATILLKKIKDSSVAKLSVTNATGQYEFEGIPSGTYFLNATFVGHTGQNSPKFEVNGGGEVNAPDIVLTKATGNLKEVVVSTRKPVLEVRADKMVMNVESSVNAVGQDAFELLRKAPGVMIDKDDNLTLSGKNGIQVYVDGRPTPLAGKDLADYLRTMQSSTVESIEIITNPSAKYEAAGNAGIINIKLKKNKAYGTNGSVTAGFNQGVYPKYNAGLSLNHRNKNINLFGNYNYSRNKNESPFNLYRAQADTTFEQHSKMFNRGESHTFKVGADYSLSRTSTIGVMVNGNFNDYGLRNPGRTVISDAKAKEPVKLLEVLNTTDGKRNNANFNLNYRYADSAQRELNVDADYGLYRITSDQFQPNYYFTPGGTPTYNTIYNMVAPTDIDIYTLKADYEQNFLKGRLGLGGKGSLVETKNDFRRYDVYPNQKELDTARSNKFDYKENVNALYANYNRQLKGGFLIQLGVRMENTHSEGRSIGRKMDDGSGVYIPYDSSFTRNYTDFFPSASVTFNKNPMSQWTLTYSRRIDRPAYQDLNPFEFKIDEYSYMKGNTELTPQYTNSIGLTHIYKYTLTTTLNYSHITDVFGSPVDTIEKSKSFMMKKNLATQDVVSLNVSYPFTYKWYTVFANLNGNYSKYKANLGPGKNIDLDAWAFTGFAQNSFRFGKGWTGELTGLYISPSIWQAVFKSSEMWSIDAGLLKTIMKGKGTIKASVSDIFKTMRWRGTTPSYAGQTVLAYGSWESRQLKLNFTYRFGSNTVKAARQRKAGLEDENKRTTSGGGIGGGQQ
ncbi:MAG: TonB-dependent receptor [Chitinophagaceae bacterium]|nr:TonB-dependent receptor [Chitinophagaceae bacterium]